MADPQIKFVALFKELQKNHAVQASTQTQRTFHKNVLTAAEVIAEMTANGQSAPAIVRCLEEECNVKTGQVEATLEPS